jgi:hypothetical protein
MLLVREEDVILPGQRSCCIHEQTLQSAEWVLSHATLHSCGWCCYSSVMCCALEKSVCNAVRSEFAHVHIVSLLLCVTLDRSAHGPSLP